MPIYYSTLEFLRQQKKNFIDANTANKVLREATINTAAAIKTRVQQQGKKQDNSPIKASGYSTKPLSWVRITNKWGAVANTRQTARRQARYGSKYLYFKGGYKEFRESLGRQTQYVDLTLSRDMFKAWRPLPVSQTEYGITFVTAYGLQISYYHEKRFGPIFKPTDSERRMALQTINRKAIEYLRR
jgi:hypothetical protein